MKKAPIKNASLIKFPVVAVGASAGGMEAMIELLKDLPAKTGMAYIYIQHLNPSMESNLDHIFGRATKMKVTEAEQNIKIEPDHLYIIPPNKEMQLSDGELQLSPRPETPYSNLPINCFFNSLAENYQEAAIGVLLSGSASDGTVGIKAIKTAGGITFAQDKSAKFQSMPQTAITEGAVDFVLPPKEIAKELQRISSQKDYYFSALKELTEEDINDRDEYLVNILQMVSRHTGVDFSQYKTTTIKRRIIRRMMLKKVNVLHDYIELLRENIEEVNLLYNDLLINVTSFFRDATSSEYIRRIILPRILRSKNANEALRIWVPACSTGQEVYSLAMVAVEAIKQNGTKVPVQIFATDLSEKAINKARIGTYTEDEVMQIPGKHIQDFFTKQDGHYRIDKSIRDMCVFATHNVAKDPPFTRLDLISCCNLLIYLDANLQRKLLNTFHYSLNNNGYLILGKSESIGSSDYLFSQVDKKFKIYSKKKDAVPKATFELTPRFTDYEKLPGETFKAKAGKQSQPDIEETLDNLLLKRYTPALVVVNLNLEILHFRGSTGSYLEPSPGKASLNLMKMAKPGLGFELRNIIHKAKNNKKAEKKEVNFSLDDNVHRIVLEAIPLEISAEDEYFVILFQEQQNVALESSNPIIDNRVQQLESELMSLREDMASVIESHEQANDELQSANEEIVSSNEELQSINEELETSKEEIESSNEELLTINQELQARNEQLAEEQEYSHAVFKTIRESLLILDKNLHVKSVNTSFCTTFKLEPQSLEHKLIFDLNNQEWDIPKLRELLEDTINKDLEFQGVEIRHSFSEVGEKVLLMNCKKVFQHSNNEEVIVLAMEDITDFKQAQQIISEREAWFRNMANNAPVMIWTTGTDGLCNFVNKSWLEFRGLTLSDVIKKTWTTGAHPDDIEMCLSAFKIAFEEKKDFELKYRLQTANGEYKYVFTRAKPNYTTEGEYTGFIGSCIELHE